MSDADNNDKGAREAAGNESMTNVSNNEAQDKFEEDFAQLIAELEERVESTRRSELLTQEDYAIQINEQG